MSDLAEVTKNVVTILKVQSDRSVKEAFGSMGAGARAAQAESDKALEALKRKLEELANKTEETGKRGGKAVMGLARDMRVLDRGTMAVQHGMFGLLASASILDDRFSKGLIIAGSFHSLTQVIRGTAMSLSGAHLAGGGIGLAGTLGLAGAALVGFAALAVGTIPSLQNSLGKWFNSMTEDGQRAIATIKKLKELLEDNAFARSRGFGPAAVEAEATSRIGVMAPYLERQQALRAQGQNAGLQIAALGMYPGKFQEAAGTGMHKQGDLLHEMLTQGRPGQFENQFAEAQKKIRAETFKPTEIPAELKRNQFVAGGELSIAQQEEAEAKKKLGAYEKMFQIQQKIELIRTRENQLKEEGDRGVLTSQKNRHRYRESIWGVIFPIGTLAENIVNRPGSARFAKYTPGRDPRYRELEGQERALGRQLPEGPPPTEAVRAQIAKALAAAQERVFQALDKQRLSQEAINRLELEQLKSAQQYHAEQEKTFHAIVMQEQAKKAALTSELGLMKPEEKARALQVAQKFAGGGKVSGEEMDFARQHSSLFGEKIHEMGLAAGEKDKSTQEIMRLLGTDRRLEQAKAAEKFEATINAEIKHQIDVKIAIDEASLSKELGQKLLPLLIKAFKESERQGADAVVKEMGRQDIEKKAAERQAAGAAGR